MTDKLKDKVMYFGHPTNTYDTQIESKIEKTISSIFPKYRILNPNTQEHALGYKSFKEKYGDGMLYFFTSVLPKSNAGVFLPFEDKKFSTGQFREAEFLDGMNKPIYEVFPAGNMFGIMPLRLNYDRRLSVDETRKRIQSQYKIN